MGLAAASFSRDRYLTIEEAADHLNVSVRFMRRLVSDRRIRHYKVGKFLRFERADLDAFAQAAEVGAADVALATRVWVSARRPHLSTAVEN
jgi:excisionase family DNA binding protein